MLNTKSIRVEFGKPAHVIREEDTQKDTRRYIVRTTETIKVLHRENSDVMTTGYRKIDFTEKRLADAYRKINKMLGGN